MTVASVGCYPTPELATFRYPKLGVAPTSCVIEIHFLSAMKVGEDMKRLVVAFAGTHW